MTGIKLQEAPVDIRPTSSSSDVRREFENAARRGETSSSPTAGAAERGHDVVELLTSHDRDVVFEATGVRLAEDSTQQGVPMLAIQIGIDRLHRQLMPDQRVSAAYFNDLISRYTASAHARRHTDPFVSSLERAAHVVSRDQGPGALDINA